MIVAIDFDDTLMDTTNVLHGYRMGQPTPGAIAATTRLHNRGDTIIVFTARDVQKPQVYKAVQDWCTHFNIPIHGITNIKKPEFDVYIDNRALHFDTWPQVMARLTNLSNT